MKQKALLFAISLLLTPSLFSQGMEPGTGFFSIGIGPSTSYISYRTSASPALRLSYDKGFKEIGPGTLTLGGVIGGYTRNYKDAYFSNKYQTTYQYKRTWTTAVIAFRVGYYYNFAELDVKELNAYGGFSVGPRFFYYNDSYDGPSDSGYPYWNYSQGAAYFHSAVFLGANYFITPKTAIYTEWGYDISWFTLGVTFNM
jgi:hypothetical protein